jgi:creatinine amidohydrolase
MELGAMTWTEVGDPIVVVPVGSCEQHGPHLPTRTDTMIATALAAELAARRGDCVVAPAIAITASGEHAGFPGTLSIGNEVLASVVIEVARSATWARGVVFVNGHGGNVVALGRAADQFERERRRVLIWSPHVDGGDPHAGHTETSLVLALAPDEVRSGRRAAGPVPELADLVRHGVRALSPNGVLGDPTDATAAAGREIYRRLSEQLARAVDDWAG